MLLGSTLLIGDLACQSDIRTLAVMGRAAITMSGETQTREAQQPIRTS